MKKYFIVLSIAILFTALLLFFRKTQMIIVSQNSFGDFSSINEAISNAHAGVIIVVYPGVYDEIVVIPDNDISIYGVDKEACIIENTTGVYKNAPIRAYGNFRLVNFTVKMTLENVGDWKPSYNSENVYETFP